MSKDLHQHGPQLEEVVVFGVFHLHHAPGVQTAPHLLPFGLNLLVGSYHCEWDASLKRRNSSYICYVSTPYINYCT